MAPSVSSAEPITGTLWMPRSASTMAAQHDRMVGVQKVRHVTFSMPWPCASLAMNQAPTVKHRKLKGKLKMAA